MDGGLIPMAFYVMDSVTRLEKYAKVRISEFGSWLESEEGGGEDE